MESAVLENNAFKVACFGEVLFDCFPDTQD
jgi:hypothetical protein